MRRIGVHPGNLGVVVLVQGRSPSLAPARPRLRLALGTHRNLARKVSRALRDHKFPQGVYEGVYVTRPFDIDDDKLPVL